MSYTPLDKKTKVAIGIAIGAVVYICLFGFLSLINYVGTQAYSQPSKVLTSDGARLFVGDQHTNRTYHQVFFQRNVFIDGVSAYAGVRDGTLYVYYGDQVATRPCQSTEYPIWSPNKEELYFLDTEAGDNHKMRIWKWTKPLGFQPVSKVEKDLYYLSVSVDGNFLTALNYRAGQKQKNALYVCTTSGDKVRRYSYGYYNFRAVMVREDDFLVAQVVSSPLSKSAPDTIRTYRWSPKYQIKTIFSVDKPVQDVLAVGGSVWALFQEPTYHLYPWMIAREADKVTVAKLSRDLKRRETETLLSGSR